MFDRIAVILKDHKYTPEQSLMKVSFFRNYDCDKDRIYGESAWEHESSNLSNFMNTFEADNGYGCNEAVEIGLCEALKDIKDEDGLS